MFDFPNTPAIGDTFAIDTVTYQWDGEKWNVDGYTPPYDLIVRSAAVLTTGLLFDPTIPSNLLKSLAPDVIANVGDPVQRAIGYARGKPVLFSAVSTPYKPLLTPDRMLQCDGIDDVLAVGGSSDILYSEREIYYCGYIEPKQPSSVVALFSLERGSAPKIAVTIHPDGVIGFATERGFVKSQTKDSVVTKLQWDRKQVLEVQYGAATDQVIGFAIDGQALELIPSGATSGSATHNLEVTKGGLAGSTNTWAIPNLGKYAGKIGRFIVSGSIPDAVTRQNFIKWVEGND